MRQLAAQATLEGDGTLNWSDGLALAQWEGVTTGGTIPSTLGTLTALTTLDLRKL